MTRRAAIVFVGAIALWLAAPVAALAAEPCAPLDLACQVDELIDPQPDPGSADDATDPVDEVVGDATRRVDSVVRDVGKVVDDLLGGGGIIPQPGVGGGGEHRPGPPTGGSAPKEPTRTAALIATTAAREGGSTTDLIPAASGTRGTPVGSALPPGGVVQAAITGALLLAGLLLVTVGFLLLQDRIDRGDPKLAIAPLRTDMVTFE